MLLLIKYGLLLQAQYAKWSTLILQTMQQEYTDSIPVVVNKGIASFTFQKCVQTLKV
jgi:hypothetical protein